jgi:hypothetical protein
MSSFALDLHSPLICSDSPDSRQDPPLRREWQITTLEISSLVRETSMHKLFLVSTAIFLATADGASAREEANPLPKAKEIASIEIEYDHPKKDDVKFQATPEDWSVIRAALTPAKRDPNPSKWEGLGTVHLTKKNGEALKVYLYTPSKPPGAFFAGKSLKQRVYHRSGNAKNLLDALGQAYEKSQADADE